MRIATIFIVLIMLIGCKPSPSLDVLEKSMAVQQPKFYGVINEIEKFHSVEGHYPSKIEEIENIVVPTVETPKDYESLRAGQMIYEVSRDKSFFRVSYGMYDEENYDLYAAMNYISFKKKWEVDRNSDDLVHLEAEYYGKKYQENLSREYLNLAVKSLIDAASNEYYPCRNFWKDWVIKYLGTGKVMNLRFPDNQEINGAVVYLANDNQPVFAFKFKSKLYPPMTYPLMIVEKVYEAGAANNEWAILQQCDSSS